jgi:DNA-binding CsgD family transcriptional regulator
VYADLPAREKAIITLMVQGKSGSAMARKLGYSGNLVAGLGQKGRRLLE